ncbi:MAG: helix-turn-helix domain-containing protein [Muribaculaceae bacterium]|nr:helix-turn-helix domain-containing protein [Muribaculaceae bacterium]
MKPIGPILKKYIEDRKLKKADVAVMLGISPNYLSDLFAKKSMDAEKLEFYCNKLGINPNSFFETGNEAKTLNYSDIKDVSATANNGYAAVNIGDTAAVRLLEEKDKMIAEKDKRIDEKDKLIEEKERTIQILMAASGQRLGTDSGQ